LRSIGIMTISPYLSFNGNCEEAFRFYASCLGGTLGPMFRYAGSPMAGQVPADWQDKIMHASVTVGGLELYGGDPAPGQYEAPRGFSLSVQLQNPEEADRLFEQLSRGATIVVPLAQRFWAARFGQLIDRFGITWFVNCESSEQPAAM
jgi:PhnB protein